MLLGSNYSQQCKMYCYLLEIGEFVADIYQMAGVSEMSLS